MPAEILRLSNFDSVNQTARTTADTDAASAQATIALANPSGFVDEQFVVIDPATENAELGQIDSIAGATLTLKANLSFDHVAGATVIQLSGNQIKLYRAANVDGAAPADADFAAYTSTSPANPITIQPDQTYTQVTDAAGGSDYWYKATYFDSVATNETSLSLAIAVRGGDFGHYASLEAIRDEAGLTEYDNVTDAQVEGARTKAESEVTAGVALAGYTLPILVEVPLLESITQMLAAGHLLTRSYGAGAEGSNKDGQALKTEARALLQAIIDRKTALVDADGDPLPNSSGTLTDSTDTCDAREPTFRMGDVF